MGGYQPKIYREQGGANLVITSSGTIELAGTLSTTGTGNIDINSGGDLDIASGATLTLAGTLGTSGTGGIAINSGGTFALPVQTAATTATVITAYGITNVTGTTVGPSFQIAAPVAGCVKFVSLTATSSGATHRATLIAPTTTVSFTGIAGDEGNTLTLASSAIHAATLVGVSATAWRIVGVYTSTMGGISATS